MDSGASRVRRRQELSERLSTHVRALTGHSGVDLDRLRLFLQQELLPFTAAEEEHLVPVCHRLAGEFAHEVMTLDYAVIRRYVRDIEEIMYSLETGTAADRRAALEAELVTKAVAMQAVVELHLEKEERVYLSLLARHLSPEERRSIVHALDADRVIKLPDSERV